MKRYWLMKSEPETYSIDDLSKDQKTWWEGVRNYQARNFMMNEMSVGDEVLFYHSSTEPPGVAGLAKICASAQPDALQFNSKSEYFEPKATKEKPIWFCVQVSFVKKFKNYVALDQIRSEKALQKMMVLKKGVRLSIQPVEEKDFNKLKEMGL